MECAANNTIAYIKIKAQDMAGFDPNSVVSAFLFDLKIPMNPQGFEYLKTAILLRYENPTMDLVNDIYLLIADAKGASNAEAVSASIRRVIRTAFYRGNIALWEIYLPSANVTKTHPPSNAEVIAGLARIVEFWQGCSEAYLRQLKKEVASIESK